MCCPKSSYVIFNMFGFQQKFMKDAQIKNMTHLPEEAETVLNSLKYAHKAKGTHGQNREYQQKGVI